MTPPDINIKRHAESQREVQMNFLLNVRVIFLFFNNQENSTISVLEFDMFHEKRLNISNTFFYQLNWAPLVN